MLEVIQKIRRLFSPRDKKSLLLISLGMTLGAFAEMLGIGLLVGVVAVFLNQGLFDSNPYIHDYFLWTGLTRKSFIILNILLIGFGLLLKNLFSFYIVYIQSRFIFRKQYDLAVRLYATYLDADYRYSLDHPYAERSNNINRAMLLSSKILLPFMQLIADGLVIIVLSAAMIFLLPGIAIGSLLFMSVIGILIYWSTRKINLTLGKNLQVNYQLGYNLMDAGLRGIKTVKSFVAERFLQHRYRQSLNRLAYYDTWLYTLGQFPRLTLEVAALLLLLGVFTSMLLTGASTDQVLLTFTMIVAVTARILPALSRCHYNFMQIRQGQYLFDTLFADFTAIPPETLGTGKKLPPLRESLDFQNLTFSYTAEKELFRNFNLHLPVRQSLGIAGKTGCGKTTLVDLLLGLQKPQSGTITSDRVDIHQNLISWRKKIGYVPQDIFILEGSIRENVAFGVPTEAIQDQQVRKSLEVAQILDFVDSQPEGLEFKLHDGGANLSGGQRQRIGIARALYHDPELLILDEATSALDHETEAAFVEALKLLHGKITMIIIAHRLSTLAYCDQILDLNQPGKNLSQDGRI